MLGILVLLFKVDSRYLGIQEFRKMARKRSLKTSMQEPIFKGTLKGKSSQFILKFDIILIENTLYMSPI